MIGDVKAGREIVDDFADNPLNPDKTKLRSLKSSVSRRAPLLASARMGRDDEAPFLAWAKRPRPGRERAHQ